MRVLACHITPSVGKSSLTGGCNPPPGVGFIPGLGIRNLPELWHSVGDQNTLISRHGRKYHLGHFFGKFLSKMQEQISAQSAGRKNWTFWGVPPPRMDGVRPTPPHTCPHIIVSKPYLALAWDLSLLWHPPSPLDGGGVQAPVPTIFITRINQARARSFPCSHIRATDFVMSGWMCLCPCFLFFQWMYGCMLLQTPFAASYVVWG